MTLSLAGLLGLLPVPNLQAARIPTIPSTENTDIDSAIDTEAEKLALEFANSGRKLDKSTAEEALTKAGIGNAKSTAAKRLLAQIKVKSRALTITQSTTLAIAPDGELGKLIKEKIANATEIQKAAKSAATNVAQELKTKAEAKSIEARQAAEADSHAQKVAATEKSVDAIAAAAATAVENAEKQVEAKALKSAAAAATKAADATRAGKDVAAGGGDEPLVDDSGDDPSKTVKSDTSVVSGAKIQVSDSLKLATVNLFAGRAYLWDQPWSLEVTSTLPASAVNPSTSSNYSDTQLQLPDGGLLNIRIGLISNLLNLFSARQDYLEAGSDVPIYGDRASEFDRYYFHGGAAITVNGKPTKEISVGDALVYFRDGLDFKGIYRPVYTAAAGTTPASNTPSTKVSDYGAAAGYYAAIGFDGGLFTQHQTLGSSDSGNYRLELLATGQYTDARSLSILYPGVTRPKSLSYAAGGRFVIVLSNHLNLDVQALWPLGASKRYMKSTLIGGFSLTR